MVHLGGLRAEQEERVVTGSGDGELADDAPVRVEHRRQRDSTRLGQAVREQPLQPVGGSGAGHPVLGEVRALGEPDPFADGAALLGDDRERVRTAERDVLDRFLAGALEPQRVLEPEPGAPHRVVLGEPVVHRRGVQRPAGGELLVRERDPEAAAVVLAHLGVRVGQVGPVAEAGDVHAPDVELRVAGGHPVGEGESDAAALRQPGHHRARDPVVPDARGSGRRAGCRRVRT